MKYLIKRILYNKKRVLAGVFVLMLVDLAQLVIPLILRRVVNALVAGKATMHIITEFSIFILVLALLTVVLRFLWRYFIIGNARKIEERIRNDLYRHLLTLDSSFYAENKTGDLMARATNDVDAIRMASIMGVVGSFDTLFYGVFSIVAMLSISARLSLYVLIPLPFLTLIILFFGKLIYKLFEEVQAAFSDITEMVREAVSGIRVIKGYSQAQGALGEFKGLNRDFLLKNMKLVKVWGGFQPLISLFAGISMFLLLYVGGRKVIFGEIELGDLVAFSGYMGMLIWPVIAIGWVTNVLQRGAASMERIQKLLETTPKIIVKEKAVQPNLKSGITIRNLSFSYNKNYNILKDINMRIQAGTRVGIMGKTGSGKTTLIRLLLRLYDPPRNTVFYGKHPVEDLSLEFLRSHIGVVPQETILFSDTIRNNISFETKEHVPDEDITNAAKIAEIYDEIMEFKNGFDTVVGERGVTLSGGQKQRIAIARIIVKNPDILIFDDALSAVDTRTEKQILDNLKAVLSQRTSIIVSQRVMVLSECDYIYVLDRGSIVQQGTHAELVQKDGLYRYIYELQMEKSYGA